MKNFSQFHKESLDDLIQDVEIDNIIPGKTHAIWHIGVSKYKVLILGKPTRVAGRQIFLVKIEGTYGSDTAMIGATRYASIDELKILPVKESLDDLIQDVTDDNEGAEIEWDGSKNWYDDKRFHHRDNDLPAVIQKDGTKQWFKHGVLHRDNGPAMITNNDKNQYWYKNGSAHREDGPAIVTSSGEEWLYNGKRHRIGGPAVIGKTSGDQFWYQNGQLHREDGPAIVPGDPDDTPKWYIHGKRVKAKKLPPTKIPTFKESLDDLIQDVTHDSTFAVGSHAWWHDEEGNAYEVLIKRRWRHTLALIEIVNMPYRLKSGSSGLHVGSTLNISIEELEPITEAFDDLIKDVEHDNIVNKIKVGITHVWYKDREGSQNRKVEGIVFGSTAPDKDGNYLYYIRLLDRNHDALRMVHPSELEIVKESLDDLIKDVDADNKIDKINTGDICLWRDELSGRKYKVKIRGVVDSEQIWVQILNPRSSQKVAQLRVPGAFRSMDFPTSIDQLELIEP